jgi:hypothetical protein
MTLCILISRNQHKSQMQNAVEGVTALALMLAQVFRRLP